MIPLKLADYNNKSYIHNLNNKYSIYLDKIDNKLAKMGYTVYNNTRFALDKKVSIDIFEDLVYYRYILCNKIANNDCLSDYKIEDIVSKIKRLLNK